MFSPKTSRKNVIPTNLTKQFSSRSRRKVCKLGPPLPKQQLLEPTNFFQRIVSRDVTDVMLSSKYFTCGDFVVTE